MPRKFRLSSGRKNSAKVTPQQSNLLNALGDQLHSHGELPYGWVVTKSSDEVIQLCQIRNIHSDNTPAVYYSLKIMSDFSWTLFLCEHEVSPTTFAALQLNTFHSIIDAFTILHQLHVCVGNPDDIFKPLIVTRKGFFKNVLATEVVAKVDASISGFSTIRHKNCCLLLSNGKTRCSHCEAHRKSLLVKTKRHNGGASTSVHTCTNHRYLTSPQLSQRCNELHKTCSSLQRKVDLLREKVERLSTKHAESVSTELSDDLRAIMNENFSQVAKKHPENTFERMFWDQHAKHSKCKDGRGFRWHPAMIRWCLYLRHLSGKAYETLRQSGVLKLPSQRTLRDYTHYIPATTGFSAEVDKMLMDTMKVQSCPPHQLYVFIIMDEMHLKSDLVYDKHTGELIGFTNLGEMNMHLLNLEKSLDHCTPEEPTPLAKSLLVFMIRGLFSSLQYPYAQFPCAN